MSIRSVIVLFLLGFVSVLSPAFAEEQGAPEKSLALPSLQERTMTYVRNPAKIKGWVWELVALRDLIMLNNAAVRYYEKFQFFPVIMRQMTLEGLLAKSYESGQLHRYRFYLTNVSRNPDDLQIHADPIDPKAGCRFFFVGPDAVIRESAGAPASLESPKHRFL